MNSGGYNPNVVDKPLFTAEAAMDDDQDDDGDDDLLSELVKPAEQQKNPTARIGASKTAFGSAKKGLLDSDSDDDQDFQKNDRKTGKFTTGGTQHAHGDTFGSKKPEAKKGGIANLLGSDDSDEDDFKVGKKPAGQAAPA